MFALCSWQSNVLSRKMNSCGVHYVRVVPFIQRRKYAQTISSMGVYRAVVVTSSAWFDVEYLCCIVHMEQTIHDMLQHVKNIPNKRIATFDSITKQNVGLDTQIKDVSEKQDATRYIHVVIV